MSDHGTATRYETGCRCDMCRRANTARAKEARQRRRRTGAQPKRHGAAGYSNYGCRCDVCLSDWNRQSRIYHAAYVARADERRATGAMLDDIVHGLTGYRVHGCRCNVCTAAERVDSQRRVAERGKANAEMRERAGRHSHPWTGPELELISRDDLTAKQVALMTGRTLYAVYTARSKLAKCDPKFDRLAGSPSDGRSQ